jgi:hypothetical protein
MAGKRIAVLSLFALVALALTVFASSGTEAGTYKVRTTYQIVNPVANAASDNILFVTIPAPDYNYEDSSMYNFAPVDGWIAMGSSIPIGAGMGSLSSTSTLGVFNGRCAVPVQPLFNLYNATVDTSKVLGKELMAWTNTARPISYRYQCSNNTNDDIDTPTALINDGCPKEASNDDGPADDALINDGCPAVGAAETLCEDDVDNDGDTTTNDGCPKKGNIAEKAEVIDGSVDADGDTNIDADDDLAALAGKAIIDGKVDITGNGLIEANDDGAWAGTTVYDGGVDISGNGTVGNEDDGFLNALCAADAGETTCNEAPGTCPDNDGFAPWGACDDDADTLINDGCPAAGTAELSSNIALADYLEYYPYFLNSMLQPPDPDGAGPLVAPPPLKPRARYAGSAVVAGSNMLIETIILSPGQIQQLPSIKSLMGAQLGPVLITALNNPWDQVENPGSVSDFCSPMQSITTLLGTTTDNPAATWVNDGCPKAGTLAETGAQCYDNVDANEDGAADKVNDGCPQVGPVSEASIPGNCDNASDDDGPNGDEAGLVSQKNQGATTGVMNTGTYISRNYSLSERDIDGDGFENDLDPCHYTADLLWNPRITCTLPGPGDTDCDGLPDSCDPDPGPGMTGCGGTCPTPCPLCANTDQDADGYNNRQDICPLVKNGQTAGEDNQADTDSTVVNADLGPGPDSIGDPCDDSDDDGMENAITGCPAAAGAGNCNDGADNDADTFVDGNDTNCKPCMDNLDANPWGASPGTGLFFHSMPMAAACLGSPAADTDGDGYCDVLEGLLGSPPNNGPETGAQCIDAENPSCVNAIDDDAADDGLTPRINDGCPQKGGDPEVAGTQCNDNVDDDSDTRINDGCPAVNAPENPACAEDPAVDNDGDTKINDGCPAKDAPETACDDNVDDDADTNVNDGCPTFGTNDDAGANDTKVNDGCPMKGSYAEVGAQCANNTSDDTPTPDTAEASLLYGPFVNDGCPAIGVPESLVIDAPTMNVPAAQPSALPPSSCSDGVDNDGDTTIDTDTGSLSCNSGDSSYTGDTDLDGVPNDGTDNCPTVWNPEQTNTDKALRDAGAQLPVPTALPLDTPSAMGDACDPDDDNDGFPDVVEWYVGTDPLANSSSSPDPAYPPDINEDRYVTVVGDVAAYAGNVGKQVTLDRPNWYWLSRLDINQDDYVTVVGDVAQFAGKIGWETKLHS